MPKNTSITISDQFAAFIAELVEQGRYGSASDVVRAGLRLLQEHETKLETLRVALLEGEESGPSTSFDFEGFIAGKRKGRSRAA